MTSAPGPWPPRSRRPRRRAGGPLLLALGAGFLLLAGCAAPIGADRVPVRDAYRQIARNILNSSSVSDQTERVLHRYDLLKSMTSHPDRTLAELHRRASEDDRRDVLLALAEVSYWHGDRLRRSVKPGEPARARDQFLSAAIYAWLFLFGPGEEPPPGPFDNRLRLAADLHNRALALGLSRTDPARGIELANTRRELPGGPVQLAVVPTRFKWDFDQIEAFLPADEFRVRGLSIRDRQSGIGAPLIAVGKVTDDTRLPRRFPATALLRLDGDLRSWPTRPLTAQVELHSSFESDQVEIAGKTVPLEVDTSAPLGYALNDKFLWRLGLTQFFSPVESIKTGIYLTQPYEPGRVPVVLVHGTASSPVWWAEMVNTLRADPALRKRYQFWNFIYNTGNPVSYSAAALRDAIDQKVRTLDPGGQDPALQQMVVIGHSQGGLLTKLTATDTGDALWPRGLGGSLDSLPLGEREKEELRRNFYYKPLPWVSRVIFVCTPHRGSYLARNWVRQIAKRTVGVPSKFADVILTVVTLNSRRPPTPSEVREAVPTSLDQMSPKNEWLQALAALPPSPQVKAHSIVAIRGRQQPPEGGDGVVKYASAHVDYVESELVVRSGHSAQDKPPVIEEVRRILRRHLYALDAAGPPSPPAPAGQPASPSP